MLFASISSHFKGIKGMALEYRNGILGKVCANPECSDWKPVSEFHPRRLFGIPVGDGYKSRCKACSRAQQRTERAAKSDKYKATTQKYVEDNKEHIREIKRAHRLANPERYKEALNKYRITHRETINAKARMRRTTNLEHYREIGRNSRARHQEERNTYQRAYNKANPEKLVAANNRRRARKHQAEGSHTTEEWETLKGRYHHTCLCCGKREPEIELTRDHVLPLEKGGSDWISNIQPLCASCNSKKRTKHIDYR